MTEPDARRRRLLLVSDDVVSAEALRAHLARHGFLLCEANSARMAAVAAREVAPDVVLIDAAIHGGWQCVMRSLEGLIERQHVVILAAYWSSDARRAAEDAGIGGILLKQLEGGALAERLRAVGDGRGSRSGNVAARSVASGGIR
jgi:DNA-binding NarL/FixJ family response regulator